MNGVNFGPNDRVIEDILNIGPVDGLDGLLEMLRKTYPSDPITVYAQNMRPPLVKNHEDFLLRKILRLRKELLLNLQRREYHSILNNGGIDDLDLSGIQASDPTDLAKLGIKLERMRGYVNILIDGNQRIVLATALEFLVYDYTFAELMSEGNVGLRKAIYGYEGKTPFDTYARDRVYRHLYGYVFTRDREKDLLVPFEPSHSLFLDQPN